MDTAALLSDRIEAYLNSLINNKKLKPGDRLPTERALAARFNVSNMPVRQALEKLVAKGLVRKEHGRGNFLQRPVRSLETTNRIAFMYCNPERSIFKVEFVAGIMAGVEAETHRRNKSLLLQGLVTPNNREPNRIVHETLPLVDGLLVYTPFASVYKKIEATLRQLKKPVVMLNYENTGTGLDSIEFDTAGNVRQVASFLAERGHRRIGCLGFQGFTRRKGEVNHNIVRRVRLFRDAVRDTGLAVDERHFIDTFDIGDYEGFRRLMALKRRPSAVLCTNDQLGVRILEFAVKAGIRIPDDLTVIGYDGTDEGRRAGLTSLAVPLEELGAEAVRRVFERRQEMDGGAARTVRIQLPGVLVERSTHR